MTHGYGSGHGPLEGKQQGQPWLPPQYNHELHQERMRGTPVLPVPYQHGYEPRDPHGHQQPPAGAPRSPSDGTWPTQPRPHQGPPVQGPPVQGPPLQGPPGGGRSWPRRHPVLTVLSGIGALLVIAIAASPGSGNTHGTASASSRSPDSSKARAAAPAVTHAAVPAAQTVTYVVSGSAADVTYGPAGSDLDGTVPMKLTKPLGNPSYYDISAQLQGGGTVSCEILVDGKAISAATASGGYNIADCEIAQDPLSGQWQDANEG